MYKLSLHWAPKSINRTYIGLFGALGFGIRRTRKDLQADLPPRWFIYLPCIPTWVPCLPEYSAYLGHRSYATYITTHRSICLPAYLLSYLRPHRVCVVYAPKSCIQSMHHWLLVRNEVLDLYDNPNTSSMILEFPSTFPFFHSLQTRS